MWGKDAKKALFGGKKFKKPCLKDFTLMSEVNLNERQDVKAVVGPTTAHSTCSKANRTSTLYKTTVIQNRDYRNISFYPTESGITTDYQP